MICKQNQEIIDTLLRLGLKDSSNLGDNYNKFASLMSQSYNKRSRKDNETLCVSLINELMDADRNENKIASAVESKKENRTREVAELKSMLKL